MRLGCTIYRAETEAELEPLAEKFDCYGLSALVAPRRLEEFTEDEAASYGEKAASLGFVIGEAGFWENLLTSDAELRQDRIRRLQKVMRLAEIMGARSTNTLVGTRDASDRPLFPHAWNFTEECKREFREIVLRVLDGVDLKTGKYGIEPWYTTFFYQPEDIRAFIDSVGHPRFGVHMDQGNMISHASFYDTTSMIRRTFDLLREHVVSVHIKDIGWQGDHFGLRWNEVFIGDGTMDLVEYVRHIDQLGPDITVYCEHFADEGEYAINFARLHQVARRAGSRFRTMDEPVAASRTA